MSAIDTTPPRPLNWDPVTKALHWSMAVLIPTAWVLAILIDSFARENRGPIVFAHKTVGLLVLVLLVVRIGWRWTHVGPGHEPTRFGVLSDWATTLGHGVLYLLMIAVPIGGILATFARGSALPLFGLWSIASPWATRQPFAKQITEVHELTAHLLLIVALAHAVIGILHHVVLKDRTLLKMQPFAKA